ncbi:hypothetical protein [Maribacter aurantiacus]|uniref:Macroglobulin domain-containing protein n=1 Tax=Maribacter aurantiacus TaxID=1882343 RepID=A0A5R8M0N9_9FLAO|nr:hypothetical protein [Maribacter aurantiacus]TLF43186.1 hypothetical protein FEK29_13815 [Maribacter aurantiacus]
MTLKTRIFLLILLLTAIVGKPQYVIKDSIELLNLKKLPQEKAFVDHTGPLVFSGEYLHYALYCFNAQNNKLTDISKIAYVILLNKAKEKVFEHKIRLEKGIGTGDFFVPTSIPSGTYKLLAYTEWMKNSGLQQVFKDDLVIINPYLVDQTALLKGFSNSSATIEKNKEQQSVSLIDSAIVSFRLNKDRFVPREKVKLSIKNYKGYLGKGTYTIKVKKKDDIPSRANLSAINYGKSYFNAQKEIPQVVGDSVFLPEQRGELLFGYVTDSSTRMPVKDASVVISIPGEDFLLKFSQTDENGNFYTYISEEYNKEQVVFQVLEENRYFTIEKGKKTDLDLKDLSFATFHLTESYKDMITERSVLNQIENQFFSVKPDSVLASNPVDPYYGSIPEIIYLDQFTRFPTFEETLVEVIKYAGYRKDGAQNDYVKITQDLETYDETIDNLSAIVLIDGIFIPNHEKIKNLDANEIEKISFIRGPLRLGDKLYHGQMNISTFNGDFLDSYNTKNSLVVNIDKPITKKNYYRQRHDKMNGAFSRIPDYRRLLFWQPHLVVESGSLNFEFFTSDIEGEYEVSLNGFTTYGKPITIIKTFNVEKSVSN